MNTIQASELRIGNFVSDGIIHSIIQDGINEFDIEIRHKDGMYSQCFLDAISPIPLNEDWLIRFGFQKIGGELWDCNHVRGLFANNEFTPLAYLRQIKYVHDLMNLYFALTGTELTLTDK